MAKSEKSVAQTILYLRPQRAGIEVLDILANALYVYKVAPPAEPVDIPLGGILDSFPANHFALTNTLHSSGRESRESTPGLYPVSERVLRIGFDTIEEPSARGFEFGSRPNSHVKVPYHGKNPVEAEAYFRIHYNFNSGALLLTALDTIKIGSARLKDQQSLLLMAGTSIQCGGDFEFIVEFPDTSNCAREYEQNYQKYAAKAGFPNAPYLESSLENLPPIGVEHRSKAILGKGAFGEVHKALNIKDGQAFAIKVLSGEGQSEMKEVNIMSRLFHENIVKYERAFRLPGGQTCIVMELAVNDLETYRKARQSGKRGSYLSLPCIRSIGRQALSGLDYLHSKGFMHRDLKPQNILVTKWDAITDIPTIKLADFGLAGIGSERQTLCGTEGYIAPEMLRADATAKALQKQRDKGMKTVAPNWLPTYTNAVDVWALGKILQEFLHDIPSHFSLHQGKRVPVNKEPALHLIDRMMQSDPRRRPTAAECLKDPWMATTHTFDSRLAQKRGRSSAPSTSSSTSSIEQPLLKVMRTAVADTIATNESSTIRIMNAIWSHGSLYQNFLDVDSKSRFVEESQIQHGQPQATQLPIQLDEDGRLPLTANSHHNTPIAPLAATREENFSVAILADHAGPRGESSSMQDVARRLLAALQAEGYGKNVTVAGNTTDVGVVREELSRSSISKLQVRQESQSSIILGVEFDGEESTSSVRNEAQSLLSHSVGLQSVSHAEGNDAAAAADNNSRARPYLEVMFRQDQVPRPLVHESSSLARRNTANISDLTQSGPGSNSTWASTVSKGVTYPRHYDDPIAEDSF